jgi:hypothetical protein
LILLSWVVVLIWFPPGARQGDVLRFSQIAHGGLPYVDQQVEYPPLEALFVMLIGSASLFTTAILVAIANAAATICCWLLIRWHWSAETSRLFLWFIVPLEFFMAFRVDAISIALALSGVVLADRRRDLPAGISWAAGILFKIWPVVLVPILVIEKRARALVVTVISLGIGVGLWVAFAGWDGVRQVESFRRASGWHIESVYGVIDSVLTRDPLRVEAGATRIGVIEGWETISLRVATLVAVGLAWWLASRRRVDPAGGPAVAAVASLLILSPVASPQYVAWLMPWAAILASERGRIDVRILALGASVAAGSVFAVYWGDPYAVDQLLMLAAVRAVCIVGLAIVGFVHQRDDRHQGGRGRTGDRALQVPTTTSDTRA